MQILLSPSKALDITPWLPDASDCPISQTTTTPQFENKALQLIELLRAQSVSGLAQLMDLSSNLANLNAMRNDAWCKISSVSPNPAQFKPAIFMFDGDVYTGLNAQTFSTADVLWANKRISILSGLYGVLRPLDWMQAHRLEMGTTLPNPAGKDLYAFWCTDIGQAVQNQIQREQNRSQTACQVWINLASIEYFKSLRPFLSKKTTKIQVIDCVFEEGKNGVYKIIPIMAKKARGLMARYIVKNRLENPSQLRNFDKAGYCFCEEQSTPHRFVFKREHHDHNL